MKIFHLSDLHLGKIVNNFSMIEDQKYVLNQIYEQIEIQKPDVVIMAGDLYDRSVPPVQAIELLNTVFFMIIKELNTPIMSIAGNHDSGERIDFGSILFKDSALYISGTLKKDIQKITLYDEYGPVNFYPIPFAEPPIARDIFADESIKTHDIAIKKIVDSIEVNLNPDERNVAIAHGYVTYLSNSGEDELLLETSESEKPLSIGGTDHINACHFDIFDYTALGHLHGPQKVGSDKKRYAGSLIKYSFSEVNQKKGITMIDMTEKNSIQAQVLPIKLKRNFRVLTGELETIIEQASHDIHGKEDYIKAVLTDTGELFDPMAKLRSVYPNAMELVRKDRIRKQDSATNSAVNAREKSKISLFENFYEEMTGEKCSDGGIDIITNIIAKIEEDLK
ncbi:MAG: exonuclease SbcCD subunit D [Proteocatella sp.]